MFTFRKNYFLAAVFFFFIEVLIAVFVRDSMIRPYGGDVLVIIFLYCLLKSFLRISSIKALLGVVIFAFLLEGLQYFEVSDLLGLEDQPIAAVVLGNHSEWLDILAYIVGAILVMIAEGIFKRSSPQSSENSLSEY